MTVDRLIEDVSAFLPAAERLIERGRAITELRAADGRSLGKRSREQLGELGISLRELEAVLIKLREPDEDRGRRMREELERYRSAVRGLEQG